jgi:hypothetical protein
VTGRPVGVGVRHEQADAGADEPVHHAALGIVGGHAVHRRQQQRVVGDDQVDTALDRLVDDGRRRVDREEHRPDRLRRVAAHQPDGVPGLGEGRVVPGVQGGDDVGERRLRVRGNGHAERL